MATALVDLAACGGVVAVACSLQLVAGPIISLGRSTGRRLTADRDPAVVACGTAARTNGHYVEWVG